MSRRTRVFLYTLFGFATLFLSLMLTFPWGALGRRIETEVAQRYPGAALTIDKIGPSLPLGIYLGGITYDPPGDEDAPTPIQIEAVRVHPAWLKLLTLKPGLSFAIKALGGKINGSVWKVGPGDSADVKISGVDLENTNFLEKQLGVQLTGVISGQLTAAVTATELSKPTSEPTPKGGAAIPPPPVQYGPPMADGTFKLTVENLKVKGGKAMGFALPVTDLGSPDIAMTITKNEAKIDTFKTKSSDIEAGLTGSFSVRPSLAQSTVSATLKVRPSDDWLARNPLIKSAIGMAGMFKKPDGSLEFPLKGPLTHPLNLPGMGHF